jgi:hypothetical protein
VLHAILLKAYSQLAIRWGMLKAVTMPENSEEKIWFLVSQLLDPWILCSLVSAFLAVITWMVALTKLELSLCSGAILLVIRFSMTDNCA